MQEVQEFGQEGITEYQEKRLGVLSDSGVITAENASRLAGIADEIEHAFSHAQMFRTRTEALVSVLKDIRFPTPDAKYWQCVREQNVMFGNLYSLACDFRILRAKMKMKRRAIEMCKDELKKELLQAELDKMLLGAAIMTREGNERVREVMMWSDIKRRLMPDMQHGTDDVGAHQLVSYATEFILTAVAMGHGGDPAERRNILGKLDMALKVCAAEGVLEQLHASLPQRTKWEINKVLGKDFLALYRDHKELHKSLCEDTSSSEPS